MLHMSQSTITNSSRRRLRKRFILWTVLMLQICFIACFWLLLQTNYKYNAIVSINNQSIERISNFGILPGAKRKTSSISKKLTNSLAVHFIKGTVEQNQQVEKEILVPLHCAQCCRNVNSNFTNDFYELAHTRTKLTGTKWCFHEGTVHLESDFNIKNIQECHCRPQWHGTDCGQPEVVWRALMAAKKTFNWLNPSVATSPHRLTLLLEGNFYNAELLELQLEILSDVVDDIIILVRRMDVKPHELRSLERKLIQNYGKHFVNNGSYMIIHCTNSSSNRLKVNMASIYGNCTALKAHEKYLQRCPFQQVGTDLFLYAEEFDLLSPHALRFFKYYGGADMPILRFRLKYNIYGFYWQHPERTRLSGLLSSFEHLHHPLLGKGDPQRLVQLTQILSTPADIWISITIGDLNHFGGWYCLYCQQPSEIIAHLHASYKSFTQPSKDLNVMLPNDTQRIDVKYVQKLIANGIFLNDAHTQLLKSHYNMDTDFAPKYAEQQAWKFGSLLVNPYETFAEESYEVIY